MSFRRRQRVPSNYGFCDRPNCWTVALFRHVVTRLDGAGGHEHRHELKLCPDHARVGLEVLLLPTRPCPMVDQSTP